MTPDKRYQVFVSSTFMDLQEERQEVIQALLELDCIPSGMELFPAANEDQWKLIKGVIDDCDYYLVIVAGRYGSLDEAGISYTEKEYRYAAERSKPIMAFLHESPEQIASGRCEQNPESKQKLAAFRELCKQRMCKSWRSATDLGGKVSRSLIHLIKTNPAVGWVRGDAVPDESTAETINKLREENETLREQIEGIRNQPPKGADFLAQGAETIVIGYVQKQTIDHAQTLIRPSITMTWDEVFSVIAPSMISEASEYNVRQVLRDGIIRREKLNVASEYDVVIESGDYHTIMVQLRALGLIKPSEARRSVKDRGTAFWSLTEYGNDYMNRLLVISSSKLGSSTS
jgi:Domain of unknown function (DUF4062)